MCGVYCVLLITVWLGGGKYSSSNSGATVVVG